MSIHYKAYNEKNTGKFCSIIFKLSNTQEFSISSFDYKKCVKSIHYKLYYKFIIFLFPHHNHHKLLLSYHYIFL